MLDTDLTTSGKKVSDIWLYVPYIPFVPTYTSPLYLLHIPPARNMYQYILINTGINTHTSKIYHDVPLLTLYSFLYPSILSGIHPNINERGKTMSLLLSTILIEHICTLYIRSLRCPRWHDKTTADSYCYTSERTRNIIADVDSPSGTTSKVRVNVCARRQINMMTYRKANRVTFHYGLWRRVTNVSKN